MQISGSLINLNFKFYFFSIFLMLTSCCCAEWRQPGHSSPARVASCRGTSAAHRSHRCRSRSCPCRGAPRHPGWLQSCDFPAPGSAVRSHRQLQQLHPAGVQHGEVPKNKENTLLYFKNPLLILQYCRVIYITDCYLFTSFP